jgi:hypothetical protein
MLVGMGLTTIVRIENQSGHRVYFNNLENSHSGKVTLPGGARWARDKIPWCANERDYSNGHFLYVVVMGPVRIAFQIWQAWHEDGDWVRIRRIPEATSGWPMYGLARPMQGASHTNGNRVLVFGPEYCYLRE